MRIGLAVVAYYKGGEGMARAIKISTLRRQALRQLKERLDEGKLTASDLLRIAAMSPDEDEGMPSAGQDWVLTLAEDDGSDELEPEQEDSKQVFADNN